MKQTFLISSLLCVLLYSTTSAQNIPDNLYICDIRDVTVNVYNDIFDYEWNYHQVKVGRKKVPNEYDGCIQLGIQKYYSDSYTDPFYLIINITLQRKVLLPPNGAVVSLIYDVRWRNSVYQGITYEAKEPSISKYDFSTYPNLTYSDQVSFILKASTLYEIVRENKIIAVAFTTDSVNYIFYLSENMITHLNNLLINYFH